MTESCKPNAGVAIPVVDRNRCEAKEDCVRVCPYNVFEIRPLASEDRKALSLMGKLKAWAHGNKQAYVARPEDCHACGLCIKACPEKALKLTRLAAA